jgi:Prokaryotic dksA/traR C4-type zinc finger
MMLETLLDAPLPHKFCSSLDVAEQAALSEAADTGGVLLRVKSLRIDSGSLVITGMIPMTVPVFQERSARSAQLRPRSIGTMRLTERSLHNPEANRELGYLVLQTPLAAADQLPESEDGDELWVRLSIPRVLHKLPPSSIGAACCACCNRPIPQARLLAIPNTKVCTNCQRKKE